MMQFFPVKMDYKTVFILSGEEIFNAHFLAIIVPNLLKKYKK